MRRIHLAILTYRELVLSSGNFVHIYLITVTGRMALPSKIDVFCCGVICLTNAYPLQPTELAVSLQCFPGVWNNSQ